MGNYFKVNPPLTWRLGVWSRAPKKAICQSRELSPVLVNTVGWQFVIGGAIFSLDLPHDEQNGSSVDDEVEHIDGPCEFAVSEHDQFLPKVRLWKEGSQAQEHSGDREYR